MNIPVVYCSWPGSSPLIFLSKVLWGLGQNFGWGSFFQDSPSNGYADLGLFLVIGLQPQIPVKGPGSRALTSEGKPEFSPLFKLAQLVADPFSQGILLGSKFQGFIIFRDYVYNTRLFLALHAIKVDIP